MKKKTIQSTQDLARHLGVSRWTISRALNGHAGVSPDTVDQIRTAMEKFGFTPSAHARGLRGAGTRTLGICFRALNTPITIQKLTHVQQLVTARGYLPLFEATELDQRMGNDVIGHFISLRVEGVLLVDLPSSEKSQRWLDLLRRADIPAALLEPLDAQLWNAVHLDRGRALFKVTDHLLRLGHTRLGLLGISQNFPLGRPRWDGVMQALAAHGKDPARMLQVVDHPEDRYGGFKYGAELARRALALPKRPTAMIALNDEVAAGALWEFQSAGLSCPGDIALFGFDNLPLSEHMRPALSTVDHNVSATAAAAVDVLFQLMEHGPAHRCPSIRIEPELVLRASVAAPA